MQESAPHLIRTPKSKLDLYSIDSVVIHIARYYLRGAVGPRLYVQVYYCGPLARTAPHLPHIDRNFARPRLGRPALSTRNRKCSLLCVENREMRRCARGRAITLH